MQGKRHISGTLGSRSTSACTQLIEAQKELDSLLDCSIEAIHPHPSSYSWQQLSVDVDMTETARLDGTSGAGSSGFQVNPRELTFDLDSLYCAADWLYFPGFQLACISHAFLCS